MSAQLQQFVNLVKTKDVQRPNRYDVEIAIPESVITKFNQEYGSEPINSRLTLMAKDTNLPGYTAAASEIHVGYTAYVAYEKANGDFSITFMCAGDMMEHKLFTIWKESIFKEDHSVAFYDDYITDRMSVKLKTRDDKVSRHCDITEAWPATITDVTVNRDERDTYGTFQVTFKYRKLKSMDKQSVTSGDVQA